MLIGIIVSRVVIGINRLRDRQVERNRSELDAIEMAKADSLYHSSMGFVESIRSGANIGGWAEGYAATCHATQLATDNSITQIGVGSAVSADGTVYTCIIGK